MTNKSGETKFNNKQIINPQLLQKIATYFSLLDNPDSGLTQEQAEVNAGKYFAENIAGKYSDSEISTAIFMSR
jgi:hypothetical protein